MLLAFLLTLAAVGGVIAGVAVGRTRRLSPQVIAIGGGLLSGISLFWVFPEMVADTGWGWGVLLVACGVAALWLINRFVAPICPTCSHDHDHLHCARPPLHGFAAPLLILIAIHSLLDGWAIRALEGDTLISGAVVLGLALHKIPEGLAVGIIGRESVTSNWRAGLFGALAESATLLGAWIQPAASQTGAVWLGAFGPAAVLGVIAGSFLYLGYHTIHGRRGDRGVLTAFLATLALVGGAALLRGKSG
jgi:zinc transporter ZupT